MAASTQMASTAPDTQRLMAQTDIGTAWESHKQNGLAFGRQCYEWGEKFKAQGSQHGSTFQNILNSLDIPRHIADFWAMKFKASIGQGIPCPSCTETFPSRTQLKYHQNKVHPELFQGTPRTPFIPSLPTRTDGSVDVHTVAIAEGCDYCRRHASCLQCPVHGPVLAKQLKDAPAVITDAVNFPAAAPAKRSESYEHGPEDFVTLEDYAAQQAANDWSPKKSVASEPTAAPAIEDNPEPAEVSVPSGVTPRPEPPIVELKEGMLVRLPDDKTLYEVTGGNLEQGLGNTFNIVLGVTKVRR